MKKVLLISYYFDPYKGVGAKRMAYWAQAFFEDTDRAFQCQVVTATPQHEERKNVIFVEDNKSQWFDRFFQGASWVPNLEKYFDSANYGTDFAIISGGPFGHFLIARYLKRKFKCKVLLDFRDPFSQNTRFKTSWLKELTKRIFERRFLRSADYAITVNNYCKELLSRNLATDRIFVIENGYDEQTLDRIVGERFNDGLIHIIYAGSFYDDRNPTLFLTQLLSFNEHNKKFRFHHVGRPSEFLSQFRTSGILVEHGERSYRETIEVMKKCSIGLIITGGEPMESTTKIYDYIGCDLDILIITHGQPRTGSIHDVTSLIEEKTSWLRNERTAIDRFFESANPQTSVISDKGRFSRSRGYEKLKEILNNL